LFVNTRPDWVPEKLFPFASHFVTVGDTHLHYIDEGRGPTLLLLHGNPTWSFLYRHLIHELTPGFRCIALDFPGFGLSQAPEGYDFKPASHSRVLAAFIQKLNLQDVIMMVQDWSGPIGLSVAVQDPSRFSGFVIGNTFAWPGKGDPHYERFSSLMGGRVAGFLIRHFNFFVRFAIPRGICRRKPSNDVMQAYLAPFSTPESRKPTHVFPKEIIGSSDFLEMLESRIGNISNLPALIVWGDRDFAFREKERKRFESIFKHHKTVMLPGAGHFIQEDAPEEIAQAIRDWWQT